MGIEFIVLSVIVGLVAVWEIYKAIKGKSGFFELVKIVELAVAAVEQISKTDSVISQMPAGKEKNKARKDLAITYIKISADKVGIKLTESQLVIVGFLIEAAVSKLP